MSCGIFKQSTIFVVGNIASKLICSLAQKDATRVLHFISEPSQVTAGESENYKFIEGDLTDRYFIQALFLQYDFTKIIVDRTTDSGLLSTIAKEQWDDEFEKHLFLWSDGGSHGKIEFKNGSFSDILVSKTDWLELAS